MGTKKGQVRKTARRAYTPRRPKTVKGQKRKLRSFPRLMDTFSDYHMKRLLGIRKE